MKSSSTTRLLAVGTALALALAASARAVAVRAGFGSAALLRHHFAGQVGVSPVEYRRTFQAPAPIRAAG